MATQVCLLAVVYAVLTVTLGAAEPGYSGGRDDSKYCACDEALINRRGFPHGFIFGSASAAYQIEGAYNENGKGPTMWDNFTHKYPEKVKDHTNADVAIDSYHLYKEDVQLLKNMGVDAYKFSISWARILPGIQPWVTILHLDTPQALEDAYGGFLSSQIVPDFRDFVDVLFREFGDRVKYWITINEPWGLSYLSYARGVFAPARCSDWLGNGCVAGDSGVEPYKVTHNQLLAHAAAVKLYKDKYQGVQKGKIGITVNTFWFVPYNATTENMGAKDRALDFMLGWAMDPITYGRYPKSMTTRVGDRLPKFTKEEAEMVKGSFDFLGVNYYSASYALHIAHDTDDDHLSYFSDSGAIFTGLDEDRNDNIPMSEALKDYKRKEYIVDHLCCLRESIENDGVNVKGYFAWSLTDNFEWISGYLVRFGLHYIDFKNNSLRRYPKYSAQWFKSILEERTEKPQSTRISDQ
ncbi:hypothetical protein DH2020_017676 [Rehmannia glutinosa]|uniref:Beta-glucosidase n=1 Tax=Rehmannia glutinosa TaxID=99300 RepID=A0ABR0WU89_REHGL